MRYAYWDGKAWEREMVESQRQAGGYVGQGSAITLDQAGTPHVAYSDASNRLIKYAVRKADGWHIQAVDRVLGVAYPDRYGIALDEDRRPYIAYYDGGRRTLKLAFQDGSRWFTEAVDVNNAGFTCSAQIDQGTIWISYSDAADNGLKVARIDVQSLHSAVPNAVQARK